VGAIILDREEITVLGWAPTYCSSVSCTPLSPGEPNVVTTRPGQRSDLFVDLPAGPYNLYLITDGPLSVQFILPGLTGQTALGPGASLSPHLASVSASVDLLPGADVAYSGGATYPVVGRRALIFSEIEVSGTVLGVGDVEGCLYNGSGPPGGVYASGCPGGGTATPGQTFTFPGGSREAVTGILPLGGGYPLPSATYSLGHYFVAAQVPRAVNDYGFWLSLPDPSPATTVSSRQPGVKMLPNTAPSGLPMMYWAAILVVLLVPAAMERMTGGTVSQAKTHCRRFLSEQAGVLT
jgi:hypothetical protein